MPCPNTPKVEHDPKTGHDVIVISDDEDEGNNNIITNTNTNPNTSVNGNANTIRIGIANIIDGLPYTNEHLPGCDCLSSTRHLTLAARPSELKAGLTVVASIGSLTQVTRTALAARHSDTLDWLLSLKGMLLDLKKIQGPECSPNDLRCLSELLDRHKALYRSNPEKYKISRYGIMGPTVPQSDVVLIFSKAVRCRMLNQGPEVWNQSVVVPLLQLAFAPRQEDFEYGYIVTGGPCPATYPGKYRTRTNDDFPIKPIDATIHVEHFWKTAVRLDSVPGLIHTIRGRLPEHSINVTNCAALQDCPIAVPIRAKRPDETLDEACFQVIGWMKAQLQFLDYLLYGDVPFVRGMYAPDVSEVFMPGIVIVNGVWYVLAAEYRDGVMNVWFDAEIGSTESVFSINRIAIGLQRIRDYIDTVYYQWLTRVFEWVELQSRPCNQRLRWFRPNRHTETIAPQGAASGSSQWGGM